MKSVDVIKITLSLVLLTFVCPSALRADLTELLYDDFDDGDYIGWNTVWPVTHVPSDAPDIVKISTDPAPEVYSLRGVGSGYGIDRQDLISRDFSVSNVSELEIEVRSKSGPQWPNSASVGLYSGPDIYYVSISGESHNYAQWGSAIGGEEHLLPYSFNPNDWHDYSWTRDADGWWSLSIDDVLMSENFWQDNQLTSFTEISLSLTRDQSYIDWVRISGNVVPAPGAILLVILGLSITGVKLRKFA